MYWTIKLIYELTGAPWPCTKRELLEYAENTGASEQVIQNLMELPNDDTLYHDPKDIWDDMDLEVYGDEDSDDYDDSY